MKVKVKLIQGGTIFEDVVIVSKFEDAKKTDYSCLVFTNYRKEPILVRQPYDAVLKSIEKAMDEYSK